MKKHKGRFGPPGIPGRIFEDRKIIFLPKQKIDRFRQTAGVSYSTGDERVLRQKKCFSKRANVPWIYWELNSLSVHTL